MSLWPEVKARLRKWMSVFVCKSEFKILSIIILTSQHSDDLCHFIRFHDWYYVQCYQNAVHQLFTMTRTSRCDIFFALIMFMVFSWIFMVLTLSLFSGQSARLFWDGWPSPFITVLVTGHSEISMSLMMSTCTDFSLCLWPCALNQKIHSDLIKVRKMCVYRSD